MGYLINSGSGYLKDAVQVASNVKSYLIAAAGYLGSVLEIGIDNFGTRVLDDGATIESYDCAVDAINGLPTASVGRGLFDAYNTRVVAASGSTEARACTITELEELNQ